MPRSDQGAVLTFPLRLLRIPIRAEVICFVHQQPFALRLFPRDMTKAVTMSVFYMFCVSSGALSVGEMSYAREIELCFRFPPCVVSLF